MPPFIFSIYSIAKFLRKVKFMEVKRIENNLLIGSYKEELTMSYEKQTWVTGDIITADKMNHMEDGISDAGKVMVLGSTYELSTETTTLDKTWKEIVDSMLAGYFIIYPTGVDTNVSVGFVIQAQTMPNSYIVSVYMPSFNSTYIYTASSEDGYPSRTDGQ